MRHQRKRPRNKPFFVHDENLEFTILKKRCNKKALFKSVVEIMKKQGATDPEIIENSNKGDLHIITHNTKDFKHPPDKIKIGVVCIGLLSPDIWIPKFLKVLTELKKHNDYYYKTILIENNVIMMNRKTGENTILF